MVASGSPVDDSCRMGIEALRVPHHCLVALPWHFCSVAVELDPIRRQLGLSVGPCRMCAQLGSPPYFFLAFPPSISQSAIPLSGIAIEEAAGHRHWLLSIALVILLIAYCFLRMRYTNRSSGGGPSGADLAFLGHAARPARLELNAPPSSSLARSRLIGARRLHPFLAFEGRFDCRADGMMPKQKIIYLVQNIALLCANLRQSPW